MSGLDQGGGVVVNIAGITKPATAKAIIKRANDYIAAMNLVGKPIRAITLRTDQYNVVFNAMNQGRDEKEPDICGLSFNGIPVEKAA